MSNYQYIKGIVPRNNRYFYCLPHKSGDEPEQVVPYVGDTMFAPHTWG